MIDIGLLIITGGLSDSSFTELIKLLQNFEGNIKWEGEHIRTKPNGSYLVFHPKKSPRCNIKEKEVINPIFFEWEYIICGEKIVPAFDKEILKKIHPTEFDLIQKDIIAIKEKIMEIEDFKKSYAYRLHEIGENNVPPKYKRI